MPDKRVQHRLQAAFFCLPLAVFAQMYAVQGVLTSIADEWEVSAADSALTLSFAMAGIAAGVLPAAWAGDRYGKLRTLRFSLITSIALGLVVPFLPTFETLLAVRFLSGLPLAAIPVLAVMYAKEALSRRLSGIVAGAYMAGMAAGGAGGRIIAGVTAHWLGWRGAVCLAALASAIVALGFLWGMRTDSKTIKEPETSQLVKLARVLTRWQLWRLYCQGFIVTGLHVSVYNYLAFRLQGAPFDLPPSATALLFGAYFAGTVTSGLAVAWLQRLGYRKTMLIALVGLFTGLFGMLIPQLWAIIIGLLVYSGSFFVAQTAAVTTLADVAPREYRGSASAIYTICFYLGSGLIGWLLGFAFEDSGWAYMSSVIFVLLLVCFVICVVFPRTRGTYAESSSPDH